MTDVPVLCFHKITDDHEWGVTTYSPRKLEELLIILQDHGYEFSAIEDASRKAKPVVITFDDGYKSVLDNALPLLEKYKSPFVVFPVINYIGELNEWDANLGGLKFRHLGEEELQTCIDKGGYIGSHGLNHKAFSLLNTDEIQDEIEKSFAYLKQRFNIPYRYFAAPFAERLEEDLVEQCKIEYRFGLDGKNWDGESKYIPRIPVYCFESPESVLRKIISPKRYGWISRLVHLGSKATIFKQRLLRD